MFAEIFINRPRLAMVIAIIITLAGTLALLNIPVAQYPDITPPITACRPSMACQPTLSPLRTALPTASGRSGAVAWTNASAVPQEYSTSPASAAPAPTAPARWS